MRGTILAAERSEPGDHGARPVLEAVQEVLRYTGHRAAIELHPEMPTGPMNRVADNALAKRLLGREPQVEFIDGLHRTTDRYFATSEVTIEGPIEAGIRERETSRQGRRDRTMKSISSWRNSGSTRSSMLAAIMSFFSGRPSRRAAKAALRWKVSTSSGLRWDLTSTT